MNGVLNIKNKKVKNSYYLSIGLVGLDLILSSLFLHGYSFFDVRSYGIINTIILIFVITIAVFKVPNTKFDIIWQWLKTSLIIVVPFGCYIVVHVSMGMYYSHEGANVFIINLLCAFILIISAIFTFIARYHYRNTDEFIEKQEKRNIKREEFEDYIRERENKKQEKIAKKQQEKEDHEESLWNVKHNDLLNRGLKYYRVGFGYNKKWYGGRREILIYVEAIDKDSAISEARKRLSPELKKQSITECVVVAGQKNLTYNEIRLKWKERNYLGSYATRG